ncbi:MAG: hypothetical protein ABI632_01355 [Pseudolysinimonas sp.]
MVVLAIVAGVLLPWRMWWLAIPIGAAPSGAVEFGQYLFLPELYASWTSFAATSSAI